ncbi:MGMT family protein [Aliikangiella sp. G2MR2-5]|uniref:MGMT family protein n=1 Tax=Aliikangiella sp. G2MR2-5 TaxID=2788943 RepID=UPI0018AA1260|nr:MGMT family protein [Aliikangiella sp. G2MR2-5]
MLDKVTKERRIQETLRKIPHGKVATYGQVADLAGLPGRARLVGKVLRESPAILRLPWQRVLRSGGCIAFEKGTPQADKQKAILQEEGIVVVNYKVDMKKFGWQPDLSELLVMKY